MEHAPGLTAAALAALLAAAGIADIGRSDPAYAQAYRDCLGRRGF